VPSVDLLEAFLSPTYEQQSPIETTKADGNVYYKSSQPFPSLLEWLQVVSSKLQPRLQAFILSPTIVQHKNLLKILYIAFLNQLKI